MPKRFFLKFHAHRASTMLLVATLPCLGLLGCASTGTSSVPERPKSRASSAPDLETRSLLLLMADQRRYVPLVVSSAVEGSVELREMTAFTLGRVGSAKGLAALEVLLADASSSVRESAAFALGELAERGITEALGPLRGASLDENRAVGVAAVEAMAKSGVPLEDVVAGLLAAGSDELLPRLVPSLYRFRSPSVIGWAEQGLELKDKKLRALAAYGLAREPQPAGASALRTLLGDSDPWIRGWAARALGRVGERADLELMRPLLDAAEPGPCVQALRAGRRLVAAGTAPPPDNWRSRLLELMTDSRPGVRLSAIEASSAWLLDAQLGARLEQLARDGSSRERELSLLALAEAGDPRLSLLLPTFAADEDPVLRAAAAQTAALVGPVEILTRLAIDPSGRVRQATLEGLLALAGSSQEGAEDEAAALAISSLDDDDVGVRAAVLGWAVENPRLPGKTLVAAFDRAKRDREPDVRLAAIEALEARAEAVASELDPTVAVLEKLAADDDYLVRRSAATSLVRLGRQAPPQGPIETGRQPALYRQIAQQTLKPRRFDVVTEKGVVRIELACPVAPFHCLNFSQLAGQGFYDGLSFHRIVPDFVVQGGDPRGDGSGGPGYTLRDEASLLRYGVGVVGMARGGPDTAGSQFFITLSPQPHLEGAYTAFGRVVDGFEVLPNLLQGDRIVRVVSVDS